MKRYKGMQYHKKLFKKVLCRNQAYTRDHEKINGEKNGG